jgi:hypothetical protein
MLATRGQTRARQGAATAVKRTVMSFYTDMIQSDPRFTSAGRVNDRAAAEQHLTLIPFETYRSQQRQQLLFDQGATKLRTVGVHHFGLACDLVKSIGGEPSWKGDFSFLKALAEQNGLIWGGDWGNGHIVHSFVDADHVQRINVADQSRLFNLSWYPEAEYRPDIA